MRYFILSVSMSRWHEYHNQFMAFRDENQHPPYPMGAVPAAVREAAGALLILDWRHRRVLAGLTLPMPQGVCVQPGRLLVALRGTNEVTVLEGDRQRRLSHPLLGNLHTVQACGPERYLVSSSATDTIVELDLQGRIRWRWSAHEHGYDTLKDGTPYRPQDERDNRRFISIAADHPAHLNAALDLGDGTVLATLFHQGALVRIWREDGRCAVVRDGLRHPHAIRRRPGGFVLSDSLSGRALLLGEDLTDAGEITGRFSWIQDTLVLEQRAMVLTNIKIASPEHGDSNRVVEVDLAGGVVAEMDFGTDQHLFAIEPIGEAEALSWAARWSGDA